MRVIGIDPSIRSTGYAVIEKSQNSYKTITYGNIRNKPKLSQRHCLLEIFDTIFNLCEEFKPDQLAIEAIIYVQSKQTAISMGAAQAAALIAVAKYGIEVYEYSPKKVKQSIVGNGNASKEQVAKMITRLLNLNEIENFDSTDALAIALTHFHNYRVM